MAERGPVMNLVGVARQTRDSVRQRMTDFLQPHRDAKALFLDGDGVMKPEAVRLFRKLAKESGLDRRGLEPTAREQDFKTGQQDMVRFMLDMLSLDEAKFMRLQQELGDAR